MVFDANKYYREYYHKNKERYLRYVKKWQDNNPRKVKENQQKQYKKFMAKPLKERQIKYKNDYIRDRDKKIRYIEEWRKNNPKKHKAQSLARYYISLEGRKCEVCKTKISLERHHKDYSKPLDVVILCKKHHEMVHSSKLFVL